MWGTRLNACNSLEVLLRGGLSEVGPGDTQDRQCTIRRYAPKKKVSDLQVQLEVHGKRLRVSAIADGDLDWYRQQKVTGCACVCGASGVLKCPVW